MDNPIVDKLEVGSLVVDSEVAGKLVENNLAEEGSLQEQEKGSLVVGTHQDWGNLGTQAAVGTDKQGSLAAAGTDKQAEQAELDNLENSHLAQHHMDYLVGQQDTLVDYTQQADVE